ncbi:MAG: thioredoxin [Bacteroidetes bacterium]|nr:thioredoxin [Bacteroidota bacterium]MCW5894532.1 thioredoxin [Bacteroidota bacterium]
MKPININDNTFESEVLHSPQLTIVDFWAPWRGPCKMIAPTLDEIAAHYDDHVKIVKMNVDENMQTSQRFDITSIPTLLFFRDGTVVDQVRGAIQRGEIETRINRLLSTAAAA